MRSLINYLLIAAIVVVAVFALIPWPLPPAYEKVDLPVQEYDEEPEMESERPNLSVQPEKIASMFGWKQRAPRETKPVATETEPAEATWISFVGYVLRDDGIRYYVFKDSRSGKVQTLSLGGNSNGWTLIAVTAEGFLIEIQDTTYIIAGENTTR